MSTVITFCDTCFIQSVVWCDDAFSFTAGLTPATTYKAVITNYLNQDYYQDVLTDGGGDFEIDPDGFPDGFFNPYSGIYTLVVKNVSGVQQDITISGSIYPCISFDVISETEANP